MDPLKGWIILMEPSSNIRVKPVNFIANESELVPYIG